MPPFIVGVRTTSFDLVFTAVKGDHNLLSSVEVVEDHRLLLDKLTGFLFGRNRHGSVFGEVHSTEKVSLSRIARLTFILVFNSSITPRIKDPFVSLRIAITVSLIRISVSLISIVHTITRGDFLRFIVQVRSLCVKVFGSGTLAPSVLGLASIKVLVSPTQTLRTVSTGKREIVS